MVKKYFLVLTIGYTLVLTILTFINVYDIPKLGSSFDDKIYHLIAYTILALLWVTYFKVIRKQHLYYIIIYLLMFSISTEILQHQINPNRTFDNKDMLANCIGVIIGLIIANRFNIFKVFLKLK